MEEENPEKVPSRHARSAEVIYSFTNASGRGLEIINQWANRANVHMMIVVWAVREEEEESSRWREFSNAVNATEEEVRRARLRNEMMLMLIDDSTVE